MAKMAKQIWTHSRLKAFQQCPYMEHLRYDEELAPIAKKEALNVGSAIHKGIETRSIDAALAEFDSFIPGSQEEQNESDAGRATVQAALTGYFERFEPFEDHEPEKAFLLPLYDKGKGSRTHFIAGKMDDIVHAPDGDWIVEYKTASQLNGAYFERLYIDDQITLYFWAARKMGYRPVGVIYRVIRKPTIRQRKDEAFAAFLDRLTAEYENRPDFYFSEEKLYRSDTDLERFEGEMKRKIEVCVGLKKHGVPYRSTCSCALYGACAYLPLCCGERGAEAMYERRGAHEELKGELIWD